MTLKEIAVGQTVKVKKLTGEGPVKRRIMDMGGCFCQKSSTAWRPYRGYCARIRVIPPQSRCRDDRSGIIFFVHGLHKTNSKDKNVMKMSSAGILLQDAACGFQTWKRTYIEAEKES